MSDPGPAPRRRVLRTAGYPLLLVLVVAVVGAPAIALSFTPLAAGLTHVFAGIVPAVLASLTSRRLALVAVAATTLLTLLAELAKPYPWAATLLMICIGLAIGACSLKGWHIVAVNASAWPATFLIAPAFSAPGVEWTLTDPGRILAPAALTLIGGAWAVLVGGLIAQRAPRTALRPQPRRAALVYGAGLAILLGAAAFVAATWLPDSTAGWVLLTILMIVRPELADTRHRMVARSAGTILGGTAAALLALLVPVHVVLVVAGVIAMACVIVFQAVKVHYATYAFALTLAIVLLNTPDVDVLPIDAQRVAFTIAGALAIAVVMVVASPLLRPPHLPGHAHADTASR